MMQLFMLQYNIMFHNLQQPKSDRLITFVQSHHRADEMNQFRLIKIINILLNAVITDHHTFLIYSIIINFYKCVVS